MSNGDPMKDRDYYVYTDDPCHPGKKTMLYYAKDKIPAKFKGKEVALKVKGVKEKEPKPTKPTEVVEVIR